MSLILIVTFGLLFSAAMMGLRFSKLPKNIWLLFLAQPLTMCSTPMIVIAGGLLSAKMAPTPELATLPFTLTILGSAIGVIPASMLLRKIGRKKGTIVGFSIAILGALLATYSAIYSYFWILVLGAVLLGFSIAFVAQLRFAALESLHDPELNPKAISVLMTSGLFAAMLGPEVTVVAAHWLDSPYGFAGSFFSLALLFLLAIIIISQLDPIEPAKEASHKNARKLSKIIKQPLFIVALSASAIAYAVMSYVMTASPLSMHEFHGYELDSVKWVVQSHILAMYLPSLFSHTLIRYFGISKLMTLGTSLYVIVVLVAIAGHSLMHYWWVMVLLGIGWNFLFTSGTLLLPEVYKPNERFKVQAVNDFGVFLTQAVASLSAGVILFSLGWLHLVSITIPIILLMFIMTFWYYRLKSNTI